jgi:hypothetical protein
VLRPAARADPPGGESAIQGTFGGIRGTFREHSGNIQLSKVTRWPTLHRLIHIAVLIHMTRSCRQEVTLNGFLICSQLGLNTVPFLWRRPFHLCCDVSPQVFRG